MSHKYIKNTKGTDWVYGYLDAARNKCKFNLLSDISFYTTDANGTKVIDQSKLANLCSNNCSNNGVCSSSGHFLFIKINIFCYEKNLILISPP